jgi:hypothetical protein
MRGFLIHGSMFWFSRKFTWSAFAPVSRVAERRRTTASRVPGLHHVRIAD